MSFGLDISFAAHPGRDGRAEHGIDGGALGRVSFRFVNANIHRLAGMNGSRKRIPLLEQKGWLRHPENAAKPPFNQLIFSTRIAAALNSAVPDFGSVASIVRRFVATSSGKCSVMNVSPGRSD